MELLRTDSLAADSKARTFRHSPLADLFAFLAMDAVLIGGAFAVWKVAGDVPLLLWVVLGPMLFFGGLILTVLSAAQLGAFRSSLTKANWLARLDRSGLWLNLRSYRNRHFQREGSTVVRLDFAEIRYVGKVTETRVEKRGQKRHTRRTRTIELILERVDTRELAAAAAAERSHEEPKVGSKGERSNLKHHHVTVFVPEPGVVRVEWHAQLHASLIRQIEQAPDRNVDLDQELSARSPEERVRELVRRGERLAAFRLLRDELDLERDEARRWLEENAAA